MCSGVLVCSGISMNRVNTGIKKLNSKKNHTYTVYSAVQKHCAPKICNKVKYMICHLSKIRDQNDLPDFLISSAKILMIVC